MNEKKTLSNWLTSKYLLIIRSEENLAAKHSFAFNYARVILVSCLVFVTIFLLAIFTVRVLLKQWLDPQYTQQVTKNQLMEMRIGMDSLQREIMARDLYIDNFRLVLSGKYSGPEIDSLTQPKLNSDPSIYQELQPIDSQFRAEYENTSLGEVSYEAQTFVRDLRSLYLFAPIEGVITAEYNPRTGHFGVDLVTQENEPVRAVADGMVVLASWTLDGGHIVAVQHRGGLISVYKHNSELTKNVGTFVSGGEIIAIVGNSGEMTSGPHLHFELWHNGAPLNPEEYIGL